MVTSRRSDIASAGFADVLESVAAGLPPSRRRPAPSWSLWPAAGQSASPVAGRRSYAEAAFGPLPGRSPWDEPLPGTGREDVARELGPLGGLSAAELARLRRSFAAANHPDCVPPEARERATIRMSLANALIDAAVASRR